MPKPRSVLLVDDDPTTTYLNKLLLTRLRIADELRSAANGKEGLDQLHQLHTFPEDYRPVLVLLDLHMPVMNGFEFLEQYQQLPAEVRAASVVVVLTTSDHLHDLARLQQSSAQGEGAQAFLAKPLTEAKLLTVLEEYFADA